MFGCDRERKKYFDRVYVRKTSGDLVRSEKKNTFGRATGILAVSFVIWHAHAISLDGNNFIPVIIVRVSASATKKASPRTRGNSCVTKNSAKREAQGSKSRLFFFSFFFFFFLKASLVAKPYTWNR